MDRIAATLTPTTQAVNATPRVESTGGLRMGPFTLPNLSQFLMAAPPSKLVAKTGPAKVIQFMVEKAESMGIAPGKYRSPVKRTKEWTEFSLGGWIFVTPPNTRWQSQLKITQLKNGNFTRSAAIYMKTPDGQGAYARIHEDADDGPFAPYRVPKMAFYQQLKCPTGPDSCTVVTDKHGNTKDGMELTAYLTHPKTNKARKPQESPGSADLWVAEPKLFARAPKTDKRGRSYYVSRTSLLLSTILGLGDGMKKARGERNAGAPEALTSVLHATTIALSNLSRFQGQYLNPLRQAVMKQADAK